MATKFPKFNNSFPSKEVMYFYAGTEWFQLFQMMEEEQKKASTFLFWVYPHVLYFSLELFVKSLAAGSIPSFDAKKSGFGHSASRIIKAYAGSVPIFGRILKNQLLLDLIAEYEKTLDTRFGETAVQLDGSDTKMMIDTVCELRDEISKKTGLQ